MKITRSQASKRLFKKLSALRATLSNEERAILDGMIVGEVAAHRMNTKSAGKSVTKSANKSAEVAAHRMTGKSAGKSVTKSANKSAEVAAHRMTGKSAGKSVTKSANKSAEVAAHAMTGKSVGKSVSKSTSKSANKSTARIAFDPNSEEYKIQD